MKEDIQEPFRGLHQDFDKAGQPKGTYPFALNAVDETVEGDSSSLSNEESNEICATLTAGYAPIGKVYIRDDKTVIFSVSTDGNSEIGILDSHCTYTAVINDSAQATKLNFQLTHQIDATYRLRRGCEDVIYFVDGYNFDRQVNLGKLDNFKNAGGDWDIDAFRLDKTVRELPTINALHIVEEGNLLPGSYNIGIALVDADFNSTEVLVTSDVIMIYNDKYSESFPNITGSTTQVSDYYKNSPTSKAIRVEVSNLDQSYEYYRIFLIAANNSSGRVSEVSYTEDIPIDQLFFNINADNTPNKSSEAEVLTIRAKISSSQHIEQIDNRLVRGNVKGPQQNYCDYQSYASKIGSELALQTVILNDIDKFGNPKRGTIHEENSLGYMPREMYAFGIVYVSAIDGSHSPVFHIPGKGAETSNMSSDNELSTTSYKDQGECTDKPFWGFDFNGDPLTDEKVRHHRFPSRAEANAPLVTENVILNENTGRYIHRVRITIGGDYDDGYNFDSIYVRVRYDNAVTGTTNDEFIKSVANTYVEEDEPVLVQFYLPEIETDTITNPYTVNQIKFVNASGSDGLFFNEPVKNTSTYTVTNPITEAVTRKIVEYSTQIMGIQFLNIELPPDTDGYYIVRMERTDENKSILDTGILSSLNKDDNYEAFASWNPRLVSADKSSKRFALTNPEFKFKGIEHTSISEVIQEGMYTVYARTYIEERVEDAMSGTSYDKALAKRREEDEDGFTLHNHIRYNQISYANTDISLTTNVTEAVYLDALASTVMEDETTIFNASGDNKIGVIEYDSPDPINFNKVPYVSLRKEVADAYSNFRSGKYYKEHTTLNTTTDTFVFHGDTYVSPMTLTTSLFYDIRLRNRSLKSGVWRIVGGSLLVAFGVVATVLTLGLGVPATAMIIGAGMSTIASGVNQAILRKTYQEEYQKGLKDTIQDLDTSPAFSGNPADDEIQWHFDILENVWFESTINMNWRLDPNYGERTFRYAPDFINKDTIKDYVLNKISIIDTENEGGRLYTGFANAETYFYNDDYCRENHQSIYFPLPIEYDCCSDCREEFTHRIHWSEQSFQEELTDHYRTFLPNNYKDIEGETGTITDLFKIQNNLYVHTEEGLWHLPQNFQERVTGDIISFVGTGSYFSIPPRRITDDQTGLSGGTIHKWATLKTPYGVLFVCEAQGTVYQFDGNQLKPISSIGNFTWFKQNLPVQMNEFYRNTKGRHYPHETNPANPYGTGFHATYDSRKERVIFTKRDFLFADTVGDGASNAGDYEVLYYQGNLLIFEDYQRLIDEGKDNGWFFVGFVNGQMKFERWNTGTLMIDTFTADPARNVLDSEIIKTSYTISYSLKNNSWRSFHSYLPTFYIHTPMEFHSHNFGDDNIWKHNRLGHYQNFYGVRYPFIVEVVQNSSPVETRLTNHVMLLTEAKKYYPDVKEFVDERHITFNKMWAYNSRQNSGLLNMLVKDIQALPENYIMQQVTNSNPDNIIIDRHERNWTLNDLRDFRINYTQPMFNSNPIALQPTYFIDKILNDVTIDHNKDWTQLESFRDKYLVLRYIFDTFDDIKLIMDYSITNEQKSHR